MDDSEIIEDSCDHCQAEASLFCEQCKCSYCSTCCTVWHKVAKRKDHQIVRISNAVCLERRHTSTDPPNEPLPLEPSSQGKIL